MSSTAAVRWGLGAISVVAAVGLLVWGVVAGRSERERERELERPIEPVRRLSRSARGDVVVALDAESQARMGLRTEPLEAAKVPGERRGLARVLPPDSLVTLEEELDAADAQVTAARAEQERARALFDAVKGVAHSTVETATAELAVREGHARAAARRLSSTWGEGLAALPGPERKALVDRLVKRQAAIARVDLAPGEVVEQIPVSAQVEPLHPGGSRLRADRVLECPQVDARVLGQSFLLLFESASPALRPGAAMAAHLQLPGPPREGVTIPRAAVIRLDGLAWVYVQGAADSFLRRELALDEPLEKGWFAAESFAAGERVVVAGAGAVLSEELRHRIQIEED